MQTVEHHQYVCRICDFSDDHPIYTVREMMFGLKEEFCYFQCAKCQCLQISETPSDMSPYYQQDYLSLSRSPENLYLNPVVSWARRERDSYSVLKKGVVGRHSSVPRGSSDFIRSVACCFTSCADSSTDDSILDAMNRFRATE